MGADKVECHDAMVIEETVYRTVSQFQRKQVRTLVHSATVADNGSDSEDQTIEIKMVDLGDGPNTDTASLAVILHAYIPWVISIPRSVTPR